MTSPLVTLWGAEGGAMTSLRVRLVSMASFWRRNVRTMILFRRSRLLFPAVLVGVLVTLFICWVGDLSEIGKILRISPGPLVPLWMEESRDSRCTARQNITFLKTHKCASSAVQNLLFRFGEKHNLLFALPSGNYFGGGTRYVNAEMLKVGTQNLFGFNIYAVHSKWNLAEMRSMMPANSVFVAIVREPSELFVSLFSYADIERYSGRNLSQFIQDVAPNDQRKAGYVGYNQMTWDFGLPQGEFENQTAVTELIQKADGLFDLVMVAERMTESLILLRKLLCAEMSDMVVLKVNARKEEVKKRSKLDDTSRALLRQRLSPDYRLYDHFLEKFDRLVQGYGLGKMLAELEEYDYAFLRKHVECEFNTVAGEEIQELPDRHKHQVFGYVSDSNDAACKAIIRPEMKYLDYLRRKQARHVINKLRHNNNPRDIVQHVINAVY